MTRTATLIATSLLALSFTTTGCHHQAPQSQAKAPDRRVAAAELVLLQDPNDAAAWVGLAEALANSRDGDGAAYEAYEQAVRLDPENTAANAGMERLVASRPVTQLQRNALDSRTNDEIWGDAGDELAARGQREQALQYYLFALGLDPDDGEWLGKVSEFGGSDYILPTMERQIANEPGNDELIGDYGDALLRADRAEEACEQYGRALELDPADSEWQRKVGLCQSGDTAAILGGGGGGMGALPQTIEGLESAIEAAPENDELIGDLADLYAAQGERERALELYRQALGLDPDDGEWLQKTSTLSGESRLELLEGLVAQHPNDDEVWGDLGDQYAAAERSAEALEAYRRALEIDPADSEWIQKVQEFSAGEENQVL